MTVVARAAPERRKSFHQECPIASRDIVLLVDELPVALLARLEGAEHHAVGEAVEHLQVELNFGVK